jgi:hypothetical protein
MYIAELGNVPNPKFSGLLDDGKGQYVSTEQQRSMLAKYDNPERHTRGLTPAFMEKGNLFKFAELINDDLFKTGSAISAHLPNPRDHAKPQLNVLQLHALFPNLMEARKLAEEKHKKFDEYDVCTEKMNVERLWYSIEPKLRQTIDSLTPAEEENKMFAICWLRLVEVTQKHTLEYIQGIQRKIEELQPQSFLGENIKEYGTEVLALRRSQRLVGTRRNSHRPSSRSC